MIQFASQERLRLVFMLMLLLSYLHIRKLLKFNLLKYLTCLSIPDNTISLSKKTGQSFSRFSPQNLRMLLRESIISKIRSKSTKPYLNNSLQKKMIYLKKLPTWHKWKMKLFKKMLISQNSSVNMIIYKKFSKRPNRVKKNTETFITKPRIWSLTTKHKLQ